ncbi:MAG TPA: SRPBCC family protein, partial [Gammaproteobacteria bacterium]
RQTNWSPAVRIVAGTTGILAFAHGVMRRGPAGIASAVAGSLLCTRSATNLEFRRLTGIGARRRAIDVQKTIHINAPVQEVFAVWSDFENFPTFMNHVRQIRRLEDGHRKNHWRWSVDGPAGAEVEFDVAVVASKPNRLLAWRTDRSSKIQHLGRVDFIKNADDSTTAKVRMSYNPIAGAVGHAVAKFFGADPKHQMDDDLVRMKTYIETGARPGTAAKTPNAQPSSILAASSASH